MSNQTIKEALDWILHISIAIVVALLIVKFVGQFTVVRGPSMEPTLKSQNVLVIEKLTKTFKGIEQGDIVVLKIPEFLVQDHGKNKVYAIKRVIALENQTIKIEDNKIYIDGVLLEEDYINGSETPKRNSIYTDIKVPSGCVYVMGDNRNNSNDSRSFGPVSIKKISGKAIFRLFPFSEMGTIN